MDDATDIARRIILEEYKISPRDIDSREPSKDAVLISDMLKTVARAYAEGAGLNEPADGPEDHEDTGPSCLIRRRRGA